MIGYFDFPSVDEWPTTLLWLPESGRVFATGTNLKKIETQPKDKRCRTSPTK
jgi:hypothetical protein